MELRPTRLICSCCKWKAFYSWKFKDFKHQPSRFLFGKLGLDSSDANFVFKVQFLKSGQKSLQDWTLRNLQNWATEIVKVEMFFLDNTFTLRSSSHIETELNIKSLSCISRTSLQAIHDRLELLTEKTRKENESQKDSPVKSSHRQFLRISQ